MSEDTGNGGLTARDRASLVTGLRKFLPTSPPPAPAPRADTVPDGGRCELCPLTIGEQHKHLLHLVERRILCVCESCWAMRSGDADFRPVGNRTVWLEDFALTDEQWAAFQIPIGLAFFMVSAETGAVVALYPSPAGATESELDLEAWERVCEANPVVREMEPDAEALVVNRLSDPPQHAIVPLDKAYALVGVVKSSWEGISGGSATEAAVAGYFAELRA